MLPSDIEDFLASLTQTEAKPEPLESLVHPEMKVFLAKYGLDDPTTLIDHLSDQLNMFISVLAKPKDDAGWNYLISPLEVVLVKALATNMLDLIAKNPDLFWKAERKEDDELYVTFHFRSLFLFLSMFGSLLFAGHNHIAPCFDPTTSSIPAVTARLANAMFAGMKTVNEKTWKEMQEALLMYTSLFEPPHEERHDGEDTPF